MSNPSVLADLLRPGHKPGENAPLEIAERNRRMTPPARLPFEDEMMTLVRRLEGEERDYDRIAYQEGVTNQKMYEGDLFGFFPKRNPWEWRTPASEETRADGGSSYGKFRYYADSVFAQHLESNPDADIDPNTDDDHDIYAARFARRVADYYERKLLPEDFRLNEIKLAGLYKGAWRYTYYSMDAGPEVNRPIYELNQSVESGFQCGGCGVSGYEQEMLPTDMGTPACPACGSMQIAPIEVPVERPDLKGYRRERIGDVVCESVSPLQMKGDRRNGDYEKGLYLRRKRLIRTEVLEDKIDWFEARSGASGILYHDSEGVMAEEMARRPARSAGGRVYVSTGGGHLEARTSLVEQWWLKPAMYARVELGRDEKLVSGKVLKAGRLKEQFPDGICLFIVNGQLLDCWGEDFNKHWVYIPFITVPHKADADSLKDLQGPCREHADVRSFKYTYLKSLASPLTVVKPPLSENDLTGDPTGVVEVPGYRGSLEELLFVYKAPPIGQDVFLYDQDLDRDAQCYAKTMSANAGDPGVNDLGGTNTARGMMILNGNVQRQRNPELAVRAAAHARWIAQVLEHFRDNAVDERYMTFRGKSGAREGRWFKGSDLEGDYKVVVREKSWQIRDDEQKRQDWANATGIGQGILLNPQAPRDVRQGIADAFQLDVDIDGTNLDMLDARWRLDQMKKLLPQAQAQAAQMGNPNLVPIILAGTFIPNPMTGMPVYQAGMVPLDLEMDDHAVYGKFYRDWTKEDEAREADPLLVESVRQQFRNHKQGAVMQAQEGQANTIAANAPAAREQAEQAEKQRNAGEQQSQAEHTRKEQSADSASGRKQQEMVVGAYANNQMGGLGALPPPGM